jgi:hypothetical protein
MLLMLFSSTATFSAQLFPENSDSIVINRVSASSNIVIAPEPGEAPHRLLISVNNQKKKTCHFYLFDMDGNLKAQVDILNNEKISFVNIEKGSYYYEILCKDERIENGLLTVQ